MPEWLIERGIGETRAALVDDGEIIEARIEPEGAKPAGSVIAARIVNLGSSGRNAIAAGGGGSEYLLPRGAATASQGATVSIEITRPAIPGGEPWKRPLAKLTDSPVTEPAPLEKRIGGRLIPFPGASDVLGAAGWYDLMDEARIGTIGFPGGELRITVAPAMTLIDVDGYLDTDELAIVGAAAAARAIRRLDIGGSIGVDLPTSTSKVARQQAAAAIDAVLPQPFERTAVNGFGFVQIVRPRQRASLIELAADAASFEARALLRRAAFAGPGAVRIVAHPAVIDLLERKPELTQALGVQTGGATDLRADPSLSISGGYAENR